MTDGHLSYRYLCKQGFNHSHVNHVTNYVDKDDSRIHIQTMEGFWGLMMRGIRGVYTHVSKKYLRIYLNEFEFRYNRREEPPEEMFEILIHKCIQI